MNRRLFLLTFGSLVVEGPESDLVKQWKLIARDTDGTVGAAALHLGTGKLTSMNGGERFPLASVCKLPIAMHILCLMDEGKLAFHEQIEVLPRDVWSGVSNCSARIGRIFESATLPGDVGSMAWCGSSNLAGMSGDITSDGQFMKINHGTPVLPSCLPTERFLMR
jgi:hypothetical protein